MKELFLWDKHLDFSPKPMNFSGWLLAMNYSEGIIQEAKNTRFNVCLFDVSHMGRLKIKGKDARSFLQRLTTNDLALLKTGKLHYNLILTEEGTIIDDITIYDLGEGFLCIVNAINKDKVIDWFKVNKGIEEDVVIEDHTDDSVFLSLQGPKSSLVLEEIWKTSFEDLRYMHFTYKDFLGKRVLISRSGYTGEDGFEIYVDRTVAPYLWDSLIEIGKKFGLKLAGLGARDILRIEAGYPLYGNDIDLSINPFEANLGWVVKYNVKDFVGKNKLLENLSKRLKRVRVGFVMEEKVVPRKDYSIYDQHEEKVIGRVTSGTYSPYLDKTIGMGYIEEVYSGIGKKIKIMIRDRLREATIVLIPFVPYRHKGKKKNAATNIL